jgi:hypothetical protein
VLNTSPARIESSGISGGTEFKLGKPLKPNAIIGYVYPLKLNVKYLSFIQGKTKIVETKEVNMNLNVAPGVRFGDGCDAVKNLPVVNTLVNISNKVSEIIESFTGDF